MALALVSVLVQISFTTYSYLISYTVNVHVSQSVVCTCTYHYIIVYPLYVHVCIHAHLAEYNGKEGHWRDFFSIYIIYALSRVQSVVGLSPTQGSYMYRHVLMRDEKEGRKKQARSNNNKAKQYSTPKAVTFPNKNELPRVGLEPTTLYTLDRALY